MPTFSIKHYMIVLAISKSPVWQLGEQCPNSLSVVLYCSGSVARRALTRCHCRLQQKLLVVIRNSVLQMPTFSIKHYMIMLVIPKSPVWQLSEQCPNGLSVVLYFSGSVARRALTRCHCRLQQKLLDVIRNSVLQMPTFSIKYYMIVLVISKSPVWQLGEQCLNGLSVVLYCSGS